MRDGYWHDGGVNWWWVPMTLMMIAFWGGLAWVVISVIRHNAHHATGAAPAPPHVVPLSATIDPRQLLAERLARGDIEIDDYRARLDALEKSPPRD